MRFQNKPHLGFCLLLILSCLLTGLTVDVRAQVTPSPSEDTDPYAIGCLLPITGKHSMIGNRAAEAMILALNLFGTGTRSPFKLFIEDTGSDPATVRNAVLRLVKERKVMVIIGLLTGEEAVEGAQEAQNLGVPVITLAQRENITAIGDEVFQFAMTPQNQIQALVEYCMLDLGMKDFAILYPNDSYGREMLSLFRTEVAKHQGTLKGIRSYEKDQTDFGNEIKSITADKQTVRHVKKHTRETRLEEEEYRPSIDFDALFIPDTYSRAKMIAPQLAYYNVRGIKLLGTSLWNLPETARTMTNERGDSATDMLLESAIFIDNFTINSFIPETVRFADLFFTNFGRNPGSLEAMAYDAVRISQKIILDHHIVSRRTFRERLLSLRGYKGATGKTSFADAQKAEKSLFILTIKDGQVIQVK